MTPKQITILVFMGFILFIVFTAIVFAIYRYIRPPKIESILYIVQPGLNYGNQLGLAFVVICIVGFFLTFYIPVINDWNNKKCNDGMIFLAPLFDKDANQTLKECTKQSMKTPELPKLSSVIPWTVRSFVNNTIRSIQDRIKTLQTLSWKQTDFIVNKRLRGNLINVNNDRKAIQQYNELRTQISVKEQEIKKKNNTFNIMKRKREEADRKTRNQQKHINKLVGRGQTPTLEDNAKLTSLIELQTNTQINENIAKQRYNSTFNELRTMRVRFSRMNPRWMNMRLKWNIKAAEKTI
jgi:hypothetical protein